MGCLFSKADDDDGFSTPILGTSRRQAAAAARRRMRDAGSVGPPSGHVPPRDNDHPTIRFPYHWNTELIADRFTDAVHLSIAKSAEGQKIEARFNTEMQNQADLIKIERIENRYRWIQFDLERKSVAGDFNQNMGPGRAQQKNACRQRWLWHGASDDAMTSIMENGFQLNKFGSFHFNRYGFGLYFASDAKLSDFFAGKAGDTHKMLLCRVICGKVYEKEAIYNNDDLHLPENRGPPDHYHSVTGIGSNREIVVHKDCRAYPAYLLTYTRKNALPDPYVQVDPGYLRTWQMVQEWSI